VLLAFVLVVLLAAVVAAVAVASAVAAGWRAVRSRRRPVATDTPAGHRARR
jgi:hypothetical protein